MPRLKPQVGKRSWRAVWRGAGLPVLPPAGHGPALHQPRGHRGHANRDGAESVPFSQRECPGSASGGASSLSRLGVSLDRGRTVCLIKRKRIFFPKEQEIYVWEAQKFNQEGISGETRREPQVENSRTVNSVSCSEMKRGSRERKPVLKWLRLSLCKCSRHQSNDFHHAEKENQRRLSRLRESVREQRFGSCLSVLASQKEMRETLFDTWKI